MKRPIELKVNGKPHQLDVDPERSLLYVLREELDLPGAKYGCGEGRCGACTVIVDGQAVKSCLARVEALNGKSITTIEGLESNGHLHPLQEAFLAQDAYQCGYCTTGMIMAGAALLARDKDPSTEAIIDAMDGNICRCGTYPRIVAAVRQAAQARKGGAR